MSDICGDCGGLYSHRKDCKFAAEIRQAFSDADRNTLRALNEELSAKLIAALGDANALETRLLASVSELRAQLEESEAARDSMINGMREACKERDDARADASRERLARRAVDEALSSALGDAKIANALREAAHDNANKLIVRVRELQANEKGLIERLDTFIKLTTDLLCALDLGPTQLPSAAREIAVLVRGYAMGVHSYLKGFR